MKTTAENYLRSNYDAYWSPDAAGERIQLMQQIRSAVNKFKEEEGTGIGRGHAFTG